MPRRGAIAILFSFLAFSLVFVPVVASIQAKSRVEVSIFMPGAGYNINNLNTLSSQMGVKFTSAKWYSDWGTAFENSVANTFANNGIIPEMTWQPEIDSVGLSFDNITAGQYDSYITQTAQGVAAFGRPIRISLAPEMNADWTPWGMGVQGNNPQNFVAFWKYVVQKFRSAGATNVSWIWSPNVIPYNAQQLYGGNYANLYPGDSYVDFMGLDGYNWGTSQSWSVWQSFNDVFSTSYQQLTTVSSKKILIMEMASTEIGGDKAAWITDMFNQLQSRYTQIAGFTWFNINKETDWRINSSTGAQAAFASGYQQAGAAAASSTAVDPKKASGKSSSKVTGSTATAGLASTGSASLSASGTALGSEKYDPTTDLSLPKIAGTHTNSTALPYQIDLRTLLALASIMSIGFAGIGLITWNRHRSLMSISHTKILDSTNWYGLGRVDSVFINHNRLVH
jgi:beta-mannanase